MSKFQHINFIHFALKGAFAIYPSGHRDRLDVAVRIDGVIYVAEKTQAAPNYALFDRLFPDEISELNLQYKNGIITAGERTRKREEIIVDGLLKKFTKGLIEIE